MQNILKGEKMDEGFGPASSSFLRGTLPCVLLDLNFEGQISPDGVLVLRVSPFWGAISCSVDIPLKTSNVDSSIWGKFTSFYIILPFLNKLFYIIVPFLNKLYRA